MSFWPLRSGWRRAPRFWYSTTPLARILAWGLDPLGRLYLAGHRLRHRLHRPKRTGAFTLCIGNAVVGGAGKTPLALDLGHAFSHDLGPFKHRHNPHYISRGYGGHIAATRVDRHMHTATDVGDEALMLANVAPCWIGADRLAGAARAVNAGADILIMDDGFYHPFIRPDINLVVIDSFYGLGNRKIIPAGPLRDTPRSIRRRADAIVLIHQDRPATVTPSDFADWKIPVFEATLSLTPQAAKIVRGRDVYAISAIAAPEKFLASLRRHGARIVGRALFGDHHPWSRADLDRLATKAAQKNALAVTTVKDYQRIKTITRHDFTPLAAKLSWATGDRQRLVALIETYIRRMHPASKT